MTIFKVAYGPDFSYEVRKEVAESCEPSMVNPEGYGAQYIIECVAERVHAFGNDKDKDVLSMLEEENVNYVEFE